ncbi:UNVERIFIED_CONTAM: hypothetical protein HDU68_001824 [Siphonaria sp. JEL0065]|nr:hypothetical protein HDU68_001824 [Siphonaria sp. JEL0065]
MDTSTVIAAFVFGAALSAGLAVAFLNRSPPNASSASSGSESKNKKKKNKNKKADRDDGSTQPQPTPSPSPTPAATPAPTTTATTTANKSSKKKKVKQVQVGTEDITSAQIVSKPALKELQQPKEEIPFPALNPNIVPKKKGKSDKATSYAFVAQSETPITKPDPASTVTPTRAYEQPNPKQTKLVEPQKPQTISVPKPTPIPYSDSESEEEEEGAPAARVLKFQEKEQLDDGWVRVTDGASTKKAPTLRLVGSSSSVAAHAFPVKPALTPQSQLTKTQLNNQRKAEKLRREKEAARIVQDQRKIDHRRDSSAAAAKEKAIAETMKRGAAMEKQRLAAVAALAAKKNNNPKSDAGSWEVAGSGSSFWD